MQNPSYAGEEEADKTVQFMEKNVFEQGLTEFNGVERLIVVNQFARIQTNDFAGLPEIGTQNDNSIEAALKESEIIIIGWGSSNRFVERQEFVLELLKRMMHEKQLYKTRMHPSRGRYADFIQPLSI
jgi:hypothetical protein